jgi:hypothetical protein
MGMVSVFCVKTREIMGFLMGDKVWKREDDGN